MEWLRKLTKIQAIILLLIGGITSLIALNGLSEYRTDYYVSAALARAFFSTILMLVIASPFLYIFRRKEPRMQDKNAKSFRLNPPKLEINVKRVLKATVLLLILGIIVGIAPYYLSQSHNKYPGMHIATDSAQQNCPVTLIEDARVIMMNEAFDPSKPPDEGDFYMLSTETNPWTSISFDVDGDGELEEILTAKIAMNHTPHILRIVKEGYVVFKHEGAGVYAEEIEDNNGFILGETIDWNNSQTRRTNYEYKNGGFIPTWYQENCESYAN